MKLSNFEHIFVFQWVPMFDLKFHDNSLLELQLTTHVRLKPSIISCPLASECFVQWNCRKLLGLVTIVPEWLSPQNTGRFLPMKLLKAADIRHACPRTGKPSPLCSCPSFGGTKRRTATKKSRGSAIPFTSQIFHFGRYRQAELMLMSSVAAKC